MFLTFSSIVTTIIFSSTMMIILYFLSKSNQLIIKLGIRLVIVCMLLNIGKLLFPIEFSFTNSIYIERIWPAIFQHFNKTLFKLGSHSIQVYSILGAIWLLGTVYFLIKLIVTYCRISRTISSFKPVNDPVIRQILDTVCRRHKKRVDFRIVCSDTISSPLVFGIREPIIALPNIKLGEKDWYYILSHEVSHFYHRDLLIKFIVELVFAFYWWNPLFYLVKNQFYKMIEINIDRLVSKDWDEQQKLEYLECLIHLAKSSKSDHNQELVAAFKSNNYIVLTQRVKLILGSMDHTYKSKKFWNGIALFITSILLITPTLYILEPSSISQEDADGTFEVNKNNSYYIQITENSYEFYQNNQYIVTVQEIFDPNITIYNSRKEALTNGKKE